MKRHSLFPLLISTLVAGLVLTAPPALADGDPEKGRILSEQHCSRCHVIGDFNPFGGIGSTASFQMIAKMKDAVERFQSFYARRPHPAFLTVPGVDKWSKAPAYATEFTITLEQVEDIVAFAKTLKKLPIRRTRTRGH